MKLDRREFLRLTGFLTVSAAAGPLLSACGSNHGVDAPALAFPQGVASGDPKSDSIVLWTRAVRADNVVEDVPLFLEISTDPGFTAVVGTMDLRAQVAFDNTVRHKFTGLKASTDYWYRFRNNTTTGPAGRTRTLPAPGQPAAQARFAVITCQDWMTNHWGAFDLLLQEDVDFVIHLGDYIYAAIGEGSANPVEARHPALALPDGAFVAGTSGARYATSLEDYRYLYRTYRSDSRLQELHARFPVIAIWDDNEFSDDAWGDHQTYTVDNTEQLARRRNANQAWFEFMPADVPFDPAATGFTNIQVYRDFKVGDLAHFIMTDERLYRADHVIDEKLTGGPVGSRIFVPVPLLQALEAQKRAAGGLDAVSMLGGTQRAWWKSKMTEAGTTWKIWGNEVSLLRMQLDLRNLAPAPRNQMFVLSADQWDGYDAERKDLMAHLKSEGIRNVVAITGDLHAFVAGQVMDDYLAAVPQPVMIDLVTAGISSTSFFQSFKDSVDADRNNVPDGPNAALASLVFVNAGPAGVLNTFNETLAGPLGATIQAVTGTNPYGGAGGLVNNPWIKYVDSDAQGYLVVTLTHTQLQAQFKKVKRLANGAIPADPLSGVKTVTVAAGSTTLAMS